MLLLALDTSTATASVALGRGEEPIGVAGLHTPKPSRDLLPAIERLLGEHGIEPADVEGYAVTIGPGSFTGLRVGIAAVQAMAFAYGRPVVGIPTLEAMAWAGRAYPAPLVPFLDARRGRVYAATFALEEGRPVRTSADEDADPAGFLRALGGPATLIGDGARAHAAAVEEVAPPGCRVVEEDALLAPTLLPLAARAIAAGEAVTPGALRPLYVRPPDARLPGVSGGG